MKKTEIILRLLDLATDIIYQKKRILHMLGLIYVSASQYRFMILNRTTDKLYIHDINLELDIESTVFGDRLIDRDEH